MNFEFFIGSRIVSKGRGNFSRPIVRLSIVSVGLGLAVMIISIAVVTGFQNQIRDKVIGFSGHIQISNYDNNLSYEASLVSKEQPFYPEFNLVEGIEHIQVFATKAGIINTGEQIEGIVLKGVGSDYDWKFFGNKIYDGKLLSLNDTVTSNDVLVSRIIAERLFLNVGDDLRVYFIGANSNTLRGRKLRISGLYETGLEEFDRTYIIGDIRHIQKLNGWKRNEVAGFELLVEDLAMLEETGEKVYESTGFDLDSKTIKQLHPQIFDWLKLQDMNVLIILILMVLVAGITMISTLLILILERTNMIGILKSMGAVNWSIRKIFLYISGYIMLWGLIFGNIFGLLVCFIQQYFGIMKLPQESYYVSVVPINIEFYHVLILNAGTLVLCLVMLVLPTYIVTRISPLKAILLR